MWVHEAKSPKITLRLGSVLAGSDRLEVVAVTGREGIGAVISRNPEVRATFDPKLGKVPSHAEDAIALSPDVVCKRDLELAATAVQWSVQRQRVREGTLRELCAQGGESNFGGRRIGTWQRCHDLGRHT
jgi:hypothetical protein